MDYQKILIEAITVGVLTILMGYLSGYIVGHFEKVDLPEVCKSWNKNYTMEKSLFLTGFLIHIFAEMFGLNTWYCKNGVACLK